LQERFGYSYEEMVEVSAMLTSPEADGIWQRTMDGVDQRGNRSAHGRVIAYKGNVIKAVVGESDLNQKPVIITILYNSPSLDPCYAPADNPLEGMTATEVLAQNKALKERIQHLEGLQAVGAGDLIHRLEKDRDEWRSSSEEWHRLYVEEHANAEENQTLVDAMDVLRGYIVDGIALVGEGAWARALAGAEE
jgi:hypothetical protein